MSAHRLARAECSECGGYGTTVTEFGNGQRLIASCLRCGGTGIEPEVASPHPAAILRDELICASKRVYKTKSKAMRALSVFRHKEVNVEAVYKCSVCGLYHLTKKRKWKRGK